MKKQTRKSGKSADGEAIQRKTATTASSVSPIEEADPWSQEVAGRLRPNWIDRVLTGFSPVLIGGMICCLVFFLITIVYSGDFTIRLMYILGLYTSASVLTARIAIEQSRATATTYSALLGIATLFVTMRFVQFSGSFAPFAIPATIGFLVLIAFLADRITYDCTFIDDSSDGSNEGLLQSLGLVRSSLITEDRKKVTSEALTQEIATPGNKPLIIKKKLAIKKRHNPGVWVMYFAFLAIPLFGLGQIMIPSWDRVRNQLAFVFLFGYLYCSLSLLVITSLLGLRRYLRQRQLEMPFGISAIWYFSATLGILLLLGSLSLVSLPSNTRGLFSLPFTITTPKGIEPSPHGWGPEGIPDETANGTPPNASDQNQPGDKSGKENADEDSAKQEKEGATGNGKQTSGRGTETTRSETTRSETQPEDGTSTDHSTDEGQDVDDEAKDPKNAEPQVKDQPPPAKEPTKELPKSTPAWSISLTGGLGNLLRWLLMVALLIFVVYYVFRYRSELIQSCRRFLDSLFKLFNFPTSNPEGFANELTDTELPRLSRRRTFTDFADPFQLNQSAWTPPKVVEHTFEAIEVWASERSLPRRTNETAEEFLNRLSIRYPDQIQTFQRLTGLYNRLAYAAQTVDKNESNRLSTLWTWMKNSSKA